MKISKKTYEAPTMKVSTLKQIQMLCTSGMKVSSNALEDVEPEEDTQSSSLWNYGR